MPRNSSGVFSRPAGTTAIPNTTISSSAFNTAMDDLASDLNAPRPLTAGGTGATNTAAALTNLGVYTVLADYYTKDLAPGVIVRGNLAGLASFSVPLAADFQWFRLILLDLNYAAANPLFVQFSSDDGANYYQAATDYDIQADGSAGSTHSDAANNFSAMNIASFGNRLSSEISIDPGSVSQYPTIMSNTKLYNGGVLVGAQRWANLKTLVRINRMVCFPGAGVFSTGRYILMGVK